MARNVEILLTRDVIKLGSMGDIVKVRPGYARNYLIPYGHAIPASSAAKRQIEVLREKSRQQAIEAEGRALALKKQIDGLALQIPARVSHDRNLFGSVGVKDIVGALGKAGFAIDPRQVHLHESFKQLGRYAVTIKLFHSVEATVSVEVVNADPNAPALGEQLAAAVSAQAPAAAKAAPAQVKVKGLAPRV